MALLLAPYTNAMRLGQGFNSYTQQICVDDAVAIDPNRAENIVTNDGTTMRIVAELTGKPSAWNRIKEVVKEGPLVEPGPAESELDTPQDSSSEAIVKPTGPDPKVIEAANPAPGSGEAVQEEKASVSDEVAEEVLTPEVGKDAAPASEDSPVSEPEETVKVPASESSSVVEVDREDAAAAAAANQNDSQAAPSKAEPSSTLPPPAGEGEKAGQEVAKTGKSAARTSRNRSSSVDNKQSVSTSAPAIRKSDKFQVKEIPSRQAQKGVLTVPQHLDELAVEKANLEKAERLELLQEEKKRMAEHRAYQRELEMEGRKEQARIRQEEAKEQEELRAEKRAFEKARREAAQKAINEAVAKNKDALTLEELNKIRAQNQFADRFEGIMKEDKKFYFDPSSGRGTSQTVTYSSKFIDKLSDITEDMCISGALSVKMAKIGGSGRGSFVDSDKFKESDLSFYVSVKVINQTVNFKDALEFNKLRSVDIASDDFNKVYGDSFISGFVEGGEFNAVVSMKVHNKAKLLDIKAEAKVALTTGPVDITAEANVGIARTNLEMNTETTIQVSWCGGGVIKPMDQPWNFQSIMEAAARFPELVSHCPQRTYAILTKYDTLRSFVALRPASFSPLQYENAQMYTNVLMDAFMTYKSIYKKLGDQSFSIQNKILEFEPVDAAQAEAYKTAAIEAAAKKTPLMVELERKIDTKHPRAAEFQQYLGALQSAVDISRFEASMRGISDARKFIRRQMVYIVNEVDLIEKDPRIATEQDHEEPFQSPLMFEERLPATRIPDRLKPRSDPLGGRRIMAKTQTESELEEEQKSQEAADADSPPLYTMEQDLSLEETASLDKIKEKCPGIGNHLRVSTAVPKADGGVLFNNLDFLFPEWQVEHITIGIGMGRVVSVEIKYDNGLILQKGLAFSDVKFKTLKEFQSGERITSVAIEVGELASGGTGERVLSICMYTTRGRRLLGQAVRNEVLSTDLVRKDGVEYKKAHTTFVDAAFSSGTLKGFFGRLDMDQKTGGLLRVGVIWGANTTSTSALTTTVQEVAPIYDTDEMSTAATIETFRGQVRTAEDQTRSVRTELSAAQDRERSLNEKKTQLEETIRNLDQEKQRYSQLANTAENSRQDAQDRLNKDRQIIVGAIQYGGRDYMFNQKIHSKVREYVTKGWTLEISNGFFEEDPSPGNGKNGIITVWSSQSGTRSLQGGEGSSRVLL
ncbi:hypothetical protein CORC01_03722 [Colletotrichum orchidophilum]|uniref:Uncharacterized protein n=1 Tax=Colletotrichum orchidophilum TaxID=1209926 RepID=A0A1G4BHM0_9PEZI|nr:uncharacterized protein CORC01_03722 [Colletotrichum orchidophilum]OHF00894.1 hypothetical protein CORC01_03722 [Colletotrichum orchidophilum]